MEKYYNSGYRSSNPFMDDWANEARKKMEEHFVRIVREYEQKEMDSRLVARLKTEYKNVENITSLCKVTIL